MPTDWSSRDSNMVRGGLLASTLKSLDSTYLEEVFTLVRYLCDQNESFPKTLIDLEGDEGNRIVTGLTMNNWI